MAKSYTLVMINVMTLQDRKLYRFPNILQSFVSSLQYIIKADDKEKFR